MSEVSIFIRPNGSSVGVYSDKLMPLYSPKECRVSRASNIEFEHVRGEWVARDMEGREIASGISREKVAQEEIEYLNNKIRTT